MPGIIPYIDPQLLGKKLKIHTHNLQHLSEHQQHFKKDDGDDDDDGDYEYLNYLKSDIYSLGVILWEISTNKIPFNDSKNQVTLTVSIILRNKRESPVEGVPEYYVDLYQNCWDDEFENRPYINYVYDKLSNFLNDELNKRSTENVVDEEYEEVFLMIGR